MDDLSKIASLPISLDVFSASISSLFPDNRSNENVTKLLGLQTQLLNNIGSKLDLIQNQLDVIFDTLEKIGSGIENLPEKIAARLYQSDIKSIMMLIKEKNKAFRFDYQNDPGKALEIYRPVFRDILPAFQVARVKLFFLEEIFTIPVVSSCLYFELICMQIAQEPPTLFNVILNSYKNWMGKCLENNLKKNLSISLENHRNNLAKADGIFAYNFAFLSLTQEVIPKAKPSWIPSISVKIIPHINFAMNKYSCKLDIDYMLSGDFGIRSLIDKGLIAESDLYFHLVLYSLIETSTHTRDYEDPGNIPDVSPIDIMNNVFDISLARIANGVSQDASNVSNNPIQYRLVNNKSGEKLISESDDFNRRVSESWQELLNYASLTNIAWSTIENIDQIINEGPANNPILYFQAELDRTLISISPMITEVMLHLEMASNLPDFTDQREKILEIRKKMDDLKNGSSAIYLQYKQLENDVLNQFAGYKFGPIINLIQNIGVEIEKGIQNIDRETRKFASDLEKNLTKGIADLGEATEVTVDFLSDQLKGYGESLTNAEKRIREGKLVDAIWHIRTDTVQKTEDNFAKAVQSSSFLNNVASSVCSVYGGPAGAAAYSAWYTYKITGDLNLALKTGIITGLTSYAVKEVNFTNGVPLETDEIIKRSLATSAIGAIAIAASGGDEKAIMEGFLKGVALSLASNAYKKLTPSEIEGRAPKNGPVLKYKIDLYEDKYLILRDPAGKDLFKTIYDDASGEFRIVPNDGTEALTLLELGKDVAIVGIATVSDQGFQLATETSIPMRLLANVPYMNDMAYFHDIFCDKMAQAGYPLNTAETAITILPATILTVAGTPTPLLSEIIDTIVEHNKEI